MTVTPYLWDSRNIYSKWKGRFNADAKPVLVRQVERRHKAGFGAAGLGTTQNWFWSKQKAGFGAVGLASAQSRFWSRHKAGFGAVGLGSAQSRFWSRHKAGFGAAGYKTGFVSRHLFASSIEATKLDLSQNGSIVTAGLGPAQSRFWWSGFSIGANPDLVRQV